MNNFRILIVLISILSKCVPLQGAADELVSSREYCEFIGSIDEARQRIPTLNKFGANYCFNTELTETFLTHCRLAASPCFNVLEVGAALGIKSAQIVQTGVSLTINDLESQHIEIIRSAFQVLSHKNSKFLQASFSTGNYLTLPLEKLGNEKFDAILIESVMHFLTPTETLQFAEKLHADLKPGGRLFVMVSSPFICYIHEVYEARKMQGDLWPGYFSDPEQVHQVFARLHKPYHMFDRETLSRVLIDAGFTIIDAHYVALPHHEYDMSLDGKEGLMVIAEKPLSQL